MLWLLIDVECSMNSFWWRWLFWMLFLIKEKFRTFLLFIYSFLSWLDLSHAYWSLLGLEMSIWRTSWSVSLLLLNAYTIWIPLSISNCFGSALTRRVGHRFTRRIWRGISFDCQIGWTNFFLVLNRAVNICDLPLILNFFRKFLWPDWDHSKFAWFFRLSLFSFLVLTSEFRM